MDIFQGGKGAFYGGAEKGEVFAKQPPGCLREGRGAVSLFEDNPMRHTRWITGIARWIQEAFSRVREWRRRRHRYRMTLEGFLFIGVTFAIGLAAFNTGTNLLYLICSMLLSFLIVSGLASTNSLRGLNLRRSAPRQAVACEPCRIEIMLRNLKHWHTSYSLRVTDRLADGELLGGVYFLAVPRRAVVHAAYSTRFPSRGVYRLGELSVTSRFPFGLFERSWAQRMEHEILVYPRLVDVRPVLRQAEVDLGEVESGKRGPGTSLYQLRESTGQESARLIHWRTSARTGRLMVMEFEKEEKRRVSIFLNNAVTRSPDERLKERFERAVVLAASLTRHLLEEDYHIQLVTGSGKVPFSSGISHLHRCLRALARIELFTPERHPFHLPPPEAECTNVFIHFDSSRTDSIYSASAVLLDIDRWYSLLDPVAYGDVPGSSPGSLRRMAGARLSAQENPRTFSRRSDSPRDA